MSETSHARSRRAALIGLFVQVLIALALFVLAIYVHSNAVTLLAWYVLAGTPIWFVTLLVFRQHELADLEKLDLDELRREKQATGGGEAMFGAEGGGGLGFLVAQTRLEWMQRWLVPIFGLLTGVLLAVIAVSNWMALRQYDNQTQPWPKLGDADIGLVIAALLMFFLFFFARYAAGLGRVAQWKLLRSAGSYMLGNAIVAMALIACLGAYAYNKTTVWEQFLAHVIPVIMLILAVETLTNFVMDIYRPRTPGSEPRACFDSRLIGLISEPGGIAHSLAEAMNYQFGFQVSHTWFYQLLQRALLPLVGVGLAAVWLLSSIVVVQPYERAIVERFGVQVGAAAPLAPGIHFKRPWPLAVVKKYNTGQLHEFVVGFKVGDQFDEHHGEDVSKVELWTDEEHAGHKHWDFMISPSRRNSDHGQRAEPTPTADSSANTQADLIRINVLVQYSLRSERLGKFTQRLEQPEAVLRDIAWNEVIRNVASATIDELLGPLRSRLGKQLEQRIQTRADALGLGLDIVYTGVLNAHPEKSVAKAFRKVIEARQERVAEIRKARLSENETLSEVAGDTERALRLAHAITRLGQAQKQRGDLERALRSRSSLDPESWSDAFKPASEFFAARLARQWELAQSRRRLDHVREDFERGAGGTTEDMRRADQGVAAADAALAEADAALDQALAPLLSALAERYDARQAELLEGLARAGHALTFWNNVLEKNIVGMEGQAAVTLARAQARRWESEMSAASEVARLHSERYAHTAAPLIYETRRRLQVLARGLAGARKYFLAFDAAGREVKVRIEAQEQEGADFAEVAVPKQNP